MSRPEALRRVALAAAASAVLSSAVLATASSRPSHRAVPRADVAPLVSQDTLGRPECPFHPFEVRKYVQERVVYEPRTVAASGPITEIPEFHDCQRFVSRNGQRFDSMYAVFAARGLDTLHRLERANADTRKGHPSATGATIYSYGGTYAPLHIVPGFNCLYLWRDAGGSWRAFMRPVGDVDEGCLASRWSSEAAGRELVVRETLRGQFADHEVPPVARWDFDPTRRLHFVGIKCGAAWCEVGPPGGFGSGQRHWAVNAAIASGRRGHRRVSEVKGWHDQQWVAALVAAGARPVRQFSGVFPDTLLGSRTAADFKSGWVPVATVILADSVPLYEQRYNFTAGVNQISLRDTGAGWEARIVSGKGVTATRPVIRRDHAAQMAALGMTVPATARWRWVANDETVWTRCIEGCCEIVGDS